MKSLPDRIDPILEPISPAIGTNVKKRVERQKLLPFSDDQLSVQRSLISSLRSPIFNLLGSRTGALLQTYFRSGWAFLIPYLAAYLLYAWLKWPVNAGGAGEGIVKGISESVGASSSLLPATYSFLQPPALLHVYWFLHAINVVLGGIALRAWWKGSILKLQLPTSTGAHSAHLLSTVYRLLPWIFLGLLLYIPGVYLEWPSDPWEHLQRINEWQILNTVTAHSTWLKSSYAIPYSMLCWCTGLRQLFWLDFYYTGICLLLCWQYYRLARSCDLSERASMMFLVLQILLFGNNIFSFYRYYGISSSIYAQLGAVALTRIAIEVMRAKSVIENRRPEAEVHTTVHPSPSVVSLFTTPLSLSKVSRLPPPVAGLLQLAGAGFLLLPLIALNHLQGIGIAALAIGAVTVWRLIEWRRSALLWLIGAVVLLSVATVLWWPRHSVIDAVYRTQGWLTAWYGFDFSWPSAAADRALHIIGVIGLINLLAGIVLLRRNHIVGWLTVGPVIALALPFVVLPIANSLAAKGSSEIITFHRFLFAMPVGLALVVFFGCSEHVERTKEQRVEVTSPQVTRLPFLYILLLLSLSALVLLPTGRPYHNRIFHSLMKPPADLAMQHVITSPIIASLAKRTRVIPTYQTWPQILVTHGGILTSPGIGFSMNATGATFIANTRRGMSWPTANPPSLVLATASENLQHISSAQVEAIPSISSLNLYTPSSQTGYLSQHWLTEEVALEHAGQPELRSPHIIVSESIRRLPQIWLEWSCPRDNEMNSSAGTSKPVLTVQLEDRGRLETNASSQVIQAGDRLVFHPVMRTLDGNGRNLSITIRGPKESTEYTFTSRPNPLGGDLWISGQQTFLVKTPGRYTVEIAGNTLWPDQTYTVRYFFIAQPYSR